MDRGRQIDNIQNTNAVYLDQFGHCGKTSVRIANPPGGQSHFSLGWGADPEPQPRQQGGRKRFDNQNQQSQGFGYNQPPQQQQYPPQQNQGFGQAFGQNPRQNQQGGVHTSVKVSHNPGGKSNIIFGTDDTHYDDYRK